MGVINTVQERPLPFKMLACNDVTKWRRDTFWDKEPETIQWIRSFQNQCSGPTYNEHNKHVFVDVGANVGIYSLYAAFLYPSLRIIAIEPDVNNYIELVKNINLNGFKNIIPMNMAIGGWNQASFFKNSSSLPGNSDGKLDKKDGIPLLSITIDYLIRIVSKIDFLKIDIDGGEYDAIFGMEQNLGKIESMLIEMDSSDERYATVQRYLSKGGYILDDEINWTHNHSRHRRNAEGNSNIENVVFKKRTI
jgi:FkbM family methyltransferase